MIELFTDPIQNVSENLLVSGDLLLAGDLLVPDDFFGSEKLPTDFFLSPGTGNNVNSSFGVPNEINLFLEKPSVNDSFRLLETDSFVNE